MITRFTERAIIAISLSLGTVEYNKETPAQVLVNKSGESMKDVEGFIAIARCVTQALVLPGDQMSFMRERSTGFKAEGCINRECSLVSDCALARISRDFRKIQFIPKDLVPLYEQQTNIE